MNRWTSSPSDQPLDLQALEERALFISQYPRRHNRWQAVRFALRGLREAWQTQPNIRLHVTLIPAILALGVWLQLTRLEWLGVSFAISLVLFAELMNTAIEQMVNLVVGLRPDPLARHVKDVAAGCVLLAAFIALLIGVFTFGPHLIRG
jgi:diacylglycerol kinase